MITQVIKRNWKTVAFDQSKITQAIAKAAAAVDEDDPDLPQEICDQVMVLLQKYFPSSQTPSVEEIQDIVEEALIKANCVKIAKAYIIYRYERAKARADRIQQDFTVPPENAIIQVIKRTGEMVSFDQKKITDAIYKAAVSVGGQDYQLSEQLSNEVVWELNRQFSPGDMPGIEEIQDMVEKVLVKKGHVKTAKAYILYREEKARLRKQRQIPDIVEKEDIANEDGFYDEDPWK